MLVATCSLLRQSTSHFDLYLSSIIMVVPEQVKIVGDDDRILPVSEVGEICFRSLYLFMYYWGEEEKTKAAKKPNGWYHTG